MAAAFSAQRKLNVMAGRMKLLSACLSTIVLLIAPPAAKAAPGQYYVQGQPASNNLYQAAGLVNDGLSLLRSNRNDEAVDLLNQAVSLAPDMPEAHHNLALALAKVGKPNEAIGHLEKVVAISPNLSSSWLTLGGLYQSTGQIDRAIATYKIFLQRFPQDSEAPKIANLARGLEKVSRDMAGAQTGSPPAAAAGTGGLTAGEPEDYLAEMTRQGVMSWPDSRMPIRVFIHPVQAMPTYHPSYQAILTGAFDDWSSASGGRVRFIFVPSAGDSDIECFWLNNPAELSNSSESGEARVFNNREGIVRGTVKLLTVPLSKELPLTDNRMRQICLHEVGHVLGLAGHTANPADAMFFSSSVDDVWKALSVRDQNTITKLYSTNFAGR